MQTDGKGGKREEEMGISGAFFLWHGVLVVMGGN